MSSATEEFLSWLYARTRAGAARSLQPMRRLIEELQLQVPASVAHVAGTNGKGSVTSMIAAGVSHSGVVTGRFTSPHVETFNERIAVDGRLISDGELMELAPLLYGAGEPVPSFFELVLALALLHFERRGVGFLALEAGVGALNDATSALGNTVVTVLTSMALDHQETLGEDLASIVRDKSAAIRPGRPVVTAETGVALQVIADVAAAAGSRLVHPDTDPELFALDAPDAGVRGINQRLAAAALRVLELPEDSVTAGVSSPPLPGRAEKYMVDGIPVLLDGAHDPAAARALAESQAESYTLIFASLARKQYGATLEALSARAAEVILTTVAGESVPGAVSQEEALDRAIRAGRPVVIAGSLYLAGEYRPLLRKSAEAQPA